ncbi:MAG: helix-turn-helix domain-containing protein [Bacteroidales bacterium]|nr:helix-turn-helix domain-containing protein [Bacteroides sp.]MCM1198590.1 helix-turn-helix domain-containing protein [Clostridium sp.]MCM1501519.1 helix-turn-helix domain-containing protein [Bacteroidales bacterium]
MINLTIEDIVQMDQIPNKISLGNDFCAIDFRYSPDFESLLKYPVSFDGAMAFFCISGSFKIVVNLKEVEMSENSVFVNAPSNILSVSEAAAGDIRDLHFIMVAMSKEYMSSLKLDANRLFVDGMKILDNPSIKIDDREKELAADYFDLICKILKYPSPYRKECLGNIISSMFYLIATAWTKRQGAEEEHGIPARRKVVVSHFLHLVSEYHMSERTVGFYADKMCLTPKYLSKLIKSATGRSAPDWIDSFVILEAKNMLKYSNMPIKGIVAKLNFPNQSVFHKFFKAHVGMTPSEYRNS